MIRIKFWDFDSLNLRFGKRKPKWGQIALIALAYIVMTISLAVFAYIVFALFFSTDVEKQLRREIKMYQRLYSDLPAQDALLKDVVTNLQYKDGEIYEQVFKSAAPAVDPMSNLDFMFASDTIPDTKLNSYTRDKSKVLMDRAHEVDAIFSKILSAVEDSSMVIPPMLMPIKNITYPQVGASIGEKLDPVYKAYVQHEGLDFIVSRGTPVYSSAAGVVQVSNTKKFGRTVEITHEGGYKTIYAHLESTTVRSGQSVSAGWQIGTVGMTGKAFAPHLHYEVRKDDVPQDPINYLFGSIAPEDYANMLYMSVNTQQSMD